MNGRIKFTTNSRDQPVTLRKDTILDLKDFLPKFPLPALGF